MQKERGRQDGSMEITEAHTETLKKAMKDFGIL